MNYLYLVSILFFVNATETESPIQRFSSMAKNAFVDMRSYVDHLKENALKAKDFVMEKGINAKNFFVEKVMNIGKRGEPMYVEEGDEPMPELSEAELKELFEKLFKDMNLGDLKMDELENQDNYESEKEGAETQHESESEKEEKAL